MKDDQISRYLALHIGRKSPNELAEETGIAPSDVVARAQEYLDAVAIGADQRYARNILLYEEMVTEAMDRMKNSSARDSSAHITAGKNALQALAKEIRDFETRQDQSDQNELYGRVLAGIVQRAMDRAIGVLSVRHPEIDPKELESELQFQVIEISKEMDAE